MLNAGHRKGAIAGQQCLDVTAPAGGQLLCDPASHAQRQRGRLCPADNPQGTTWQTVHSSPLASTSGPEPCAHQSPLDELVPSGQAFPKKPPPPGASTYAPSRLAPEGPGGPTGP